MAHSGKANSLTPAQLDELRQLSTCVVSSAIEPFGVRLNNTGFADSTVHCQFRDLPPVIGYAATARIRSQDPPMGGDGYFYYDRPDWWKNILTIPPPRVAVIEDVDDPPGLGAFVGAVHAQILRALGCVAVVTNGTVRDISDIQPTGFQLFASNVAVSHAYAHLFDFGGSVRVGGLNVVPGELVHGDLHGVQTIPLEVADKVPAVAREILTRRKRLIELCRSPDFSLETLQKLMKEEEKERLNV
jgi:4-hydroxy-4-methyl-2-oxoglutarate aldolase